MLVMKLWLCCCEMMWAFWEFNFEFVFFELWVFFILVCMNLILNEYMFCWWKFSVFFILVLISIVSSFDLKMLIVLMKLWCCWDLFWNKKVLRCWIGKFLIRICLVCFSWKKLLCLLFWFLLFLLCCLILLVCW